MQTRDRLQKKSQSPDGCGGIVQQFEGHIKRRAEFLSVLQSEDVHVRGYAAPREFRGTINAVRRFPQQTSEGCANRAGARSSGSFRGRLSSPDGSSRRYSTTRPERRLPAARRTGSYRSGRTVRRRSGRTLPTEFLIRRALVFAGDRLMKLPPLSFDSQNTHPQSAMSAGLASDGRVRCDPTGALPTPRRRNPIRVFRSDS